MGSSPLRNGRSGGGRRRLANVEATQPEALVSAAATRALEGLPADGLGGSAGGVPVSMGNWHWDVNEAIRLAGLDAEPWS
jgi:hypothetical protein